MLIPGLIIRRKPLETYLIVHEGDDEDTWDRELTPEEIEKLWAAENVHAELLAAAKGVLFAFENTPIKGRYPTRYPKYFETLQTAIAKAEGAP